MLQLFLFYLKGISFFFITYVFFVETKHVLESLVQKNMFTALNLVSANLCSWDHNQKKRNFRSPLIKNYLALNLTREQFYTFAFIFHRYKWLTSCMYMYAFWNFHVAPRWKTLSFYGVLFYICDIFCMCDNKKVLIIWRIFCMISMIFFYDLNSLKSIVKVFFLEG